MRKRKKIKGFTLVEMLVTTSIITLLSLTFLAYSHSEASLGNLNRYAQKLASDLKEARNNALNMKDLIDISNRRFIYCGWGIHFEPSQNQYFLFKDKCTLSNRGNRVYDSSDVKLITFKIGQGIVLETSVRDLVFEPPLPTVCFDGNCNPSSPGEIILKGSNYQFTISVNPIGLIIGK